MKLFKHIITKCDNKKILLLLIAWTLIFVLLSIVTSHTNEKSTNDDVLLKTILSKRQNTLKDSTPQVQMYYYIKQYAKEYDINENILFSIANIETGYQGPLHTTYKHNLSSSVAHGPMQITNSTANMINGVPISTHELKNNIEKNIQLSAKLLSYLYNRYGSWDKVISAYNTGNPNIAHGSYTQIVKNISYTDNIKNKWVK